MAESSEEFDVKSALLDCLETIGDEIESSFYAKGPLEECTPGLHIEEIGRIGLPISEHDVQRIIGKSRQAPFGKGSNTVVDTAVRNTWEIDATCINLNHPKWLWRQQLIVDDVARQMGIARGSEIVQAQLYKLLLYEPGAMFKPHKDYATFLHTEKADGMFGTLAVCLPCKHTGGDVEVSFNGKKATLSTATTSEWSVSYLAWYADVLHEVKPVTSGYRVVLTFNLVQSNSALKRSFANHDGQTASLMATLTQWDETSHHYYLIYPLEHEYTEASLSLAGLKGKDLNKVQSVAKAAQETDFLCYLASVEKKVSGGVDEDGYGYYGGTHEILEEGDFVQEDAFERDPDDEDFSGFTGNEGAETTHWYHDTALVILPRDNAIDLSLERSKLEKSEVGKAFYRESRATNELVDFIKQQMQKYVSDPTDARQKKDTDRLCHELVIGNIMGNGVKELRSIQSKYTLPSETCLPYADEVMGLVAEVGLLLGKLETAEHAVAAVEEHIPQQAILDMAAHFGGYSFAQLRGCFDNVAKSFNDVKGRIRACNSLLSGFQSHSTEDQAAALAWGRTQEDCLVTETRDVTRKDAAPIVGIACGRESSEWLLQKAIPFVCRQSDNAAFTFAFVHELSQALKEKRLARETCALAFQQICDAIIAGFKLPVVRLPAAPSQQLVMAYDLSLPQLHSRSMREPNTSLSVQDMLVIHHTCLDVDMRPQLSNFLEKVSNEASHVGLDYFKSLVIPYLRGVVEMSKRENFELGTEDNRRLFARVLGAYIGRYVKMEPIRPSNWTKESSGCKSPVCRDCRQLDAFLASPTEQTKHFKMAEKRRKHLERQLPSFYGYSFGVSDISSTTERHTTPLTLVISKSHKRFEKELRDWKERAKEALQKMLEIASVQDLKMILRDAYDSINTLKLVRVSTPANDPQRQAARPSEAGTPLGWLPNPPGYSNVVPSGYNVSAKRKEQPGPAEQPKIPKRAKMTQVIDLNNSP